MRSKLLGERLSSLMLPEPLAPLLCLLHRLLDHGRNRVARQPVPYRPAWFIDWRHQGKTAKLRGPHLRALMDQLRPLDLSSLARLLCASRSTLHRWTSASDRGRQNLLQRELLVRLDALRALVALPPCAVARGTILGGMRGKSWSHTMESPVAGADQVRTD